MQPQVSQMHHFLSKYDSHFFASSFIVWKVCQPHLKFSRKTTTSLVFEKLNTIQILVKQVCRKFSLLGKNHLNTLVAQALKVKNETLKFGNDKKKKKKKKKHNLKMHIMVFSYTTTQMTGICPHTHPHKRDRCKNTALVMSKQIKDLHTSCSSFQSRSYRCNIVVQLGEC